MNCSWFWSLFGEFLFPSSGEGNFGGDPSLLSLSKLPYPWYIFYINILLTWIKLLSMFIDCDLFTAERTDSESYSRLLFWREFLRTRFAWGVRHIVSALANPHKLKRKSEVRLKALLRCPAFQKLKM